MRSVKLNSIRELKSQEGERGEVGVIGCSIISQGNLSIRDEGANLYE